MNSLHKVLRETYRTAWLTRNNAMKGVARALYELQEARSTADATQTWLESVGAELRASGFDKADDYLGRVWPIAKPEEFVFSPSTAVYE